MIFFLYKLFDCFVKCKLSAFALRRQSNFSLLPKQTLWPGIRQSFHLLPAFQLQVFLICTLKHTHQNYHVFQSGIFMVSYNVVKNKPPIKEMSYRSTIRKQQRAAIKAMPPAGQQSSAAQKAWERMNRFATFCPFTLLISSFCSTPV